MNSSEIRQRFLKFFEKRGHAIIESTSLITPLEKVVTNSTLFNTAGMQPLIPYLLGQPYLVGGQEIKRLVNVQKCLRTVDLDEVGDQVHATFFEMLGNWSLGDYFKKEAIGWSYEFLTSKAEGLGLDPNRLYITVFEGDANAPKDDEAASIWAEIFTKNNIDAQRIFYMPASSNWWEAGDNGPCGPDTEMYYDTMNKFGGKCITKEQFIEAESQREIVEVWNDVFMQYQKKEGKIVGKLSKPSVDTGAGLERLAMIMQGVDNIYETDLLKSVMEVARGGIVYEIKNEESYYQIIFKERIIADHIRASVFLIADGLIPSNTDRGYVLRRLIRRAIINANDKKIDQAKVNDFVEAVINIYNDAYPELKNKSDLVKKVLKEEIKIFAKTLEYGIKEFEKIANKSETISGSDAFNLFSSYGLPINMILELAKDKHKKVEIKDFEKCFKKHQEISRASVTQKFKGGLADAKDDMVLRYHTATHLLHQALRDVLGDSVMQKGSNITAERLRFDFSHNVKMTDDEKKRVENIVNEKIKQELPMNNVVLPREEAEKSGARHFFGEKYGDQISIYFIGNDLDSAYSKEFCGGPHVKNTKELGGPEGKWKFKIQKEEAVSQGIRRIKAILC